MIRNYLFLVLDRHKSNYYDENSKNVRKFCRELFSVSFWLMIQSIGHGPWMK